MPSDEEKEQILECETRIVAHRILQARKSQIVTKAARWMDIYHAGCDSAAAYKKVADIDEARRKVIIVAVTGIVTCGAFTVEAAILSRLGGYAYTSFSMATPIVATSVQSGSLTVVTAVPLSQSFAATLGLFLAKTAIFSVPTGLILQRELGDSALSLGLSFALEKAGLKTIKEYSPEDFARQRELFVSTCIGDERFRKLMSDPSSREPEVKEAIKRMVETRVASALIDVLARAPRPANLLLLMNDDDLAKWYSKFRDDIVQYINKQYASWSRDDRSLLQNKLLYDFWNQIIVDLNELDRKWTQDIHTLRCASHDALLSLRAIYEMMNRSVAPKVGPGKIETPKKGKIIIRAY